MACPPGDIWSGSVSGRWPQPSTARRIWSRRSRPRGPTPAGAACPWVAYDAPHEYFRTMAWLAERIGDRRPRVRASRFALQLEAIRAGAGLGILPCFVGDADPGAGATHRPVAELAADQWLLVHPDLKGVSRVRLMMEWIRATFREGRLCARGSAPVRGARAEPRPGSRCRRARRGARSDADEDAPPVERAHHGQPDQHVGEREEERGVRGRRPGGEERACRSSGGG